jgi:hypothetical protein
MKTDKHKEGKEKKQEHTIEQTWLEQGVFDKPMTKQKDKLKKEK